MKEEERLESYNRAIEQWGIPNQVLMVVEECGEMLNALAKINRNRSTPDEVITELVDVTILMEQMAVVFGYGRYKAEMKRKLERLKNRLDAKYSLINKEK